MPSSTGVIGHLYDFEKFKSGAADAVRSLRDDGLADFAHAIMTTDTRPKTASTTFKAGGATITLAGAVKGVGHDLAEDGDDARLPRDRRGDRSR